HVRVSHRQLIIRTPSTSVGGVFLCGKKTLRRKVEERSLKQYIYNNKLCEKYSIYQNIINYCKSIWSNLSTTLV
ncbi:hypothetical protein, partial [Acinetobacter towneri]|uniref:hypothetical protein n=1 Tax=Acinetobacter towneri TaxID=202956 RepID=UPI003A8A9C53